MGANKVPDKGAHDHDSDVATTADHRELAFDLEICRQPCEERLVAALGSGGEQTSQDRGPDEFRREYFERPLPEASRGDLFPGGLEHWRILNEAPQKKTMNAGAKPTQNKVRQAISCGNAVKSEVEGTAATAQPMDHPLWTKPTALPRCRARITSPINTAPAAHSLPKPNPINAREISS